MARANDPDSADSHFSYVMTSYHLLTANTRFGVKLLMVCITLIGFQLEKEVMGKCYQILLRLLQ